jgi:hypothetical protein
MGIFMITISQISSHTMGPSVALNSAGYRRLDRPFDQRFSGRVELRHCEGCARAPELDSAACRDPDRKPGEHLIDFRVAALVDADPMGTWNRLDPRVGEWPPLSVTTENVEPWVEEAAVQEPSR